MKLKIQGLVLNSTEINEEVVLLDGAPTEERLQVLKSQIPQRYQTIPD
jgi:hypothetical protein